MRLRRLGTTARAALWAVAPMLAAVALWIGLHRHYSTDEFSVRVRESLEQHRQLPRSQQPDNFRVAVRRTLTPGVHVAKLYTHQLHSVGLTAGRDILRLVQSLSTLFYWILRPIVWLGSWCLRWGCIGAYIVLYEYLILRGLLSPQAIQHMSNLLRKSVQWQRSLTPRQVALEVAVVTSVVVLYKVVKFLQRRRYLQSLQGWISRRKYAVARSYQKTVQRVTLVSVTLALMIPHAIFAGSCVAIKLLLPGLVTWVATETQANALFAIAFPWLLTMWVLSRMHRLQREQQTFLDEQQESDDQLSRAALAQRREDKRALELQIEQQERQTLYLIRYWIVSATVALIKEVCRLMPLSQRFLKVYPPLRLALVQMELAVWVWVHVVPYALTPVYIRQLESYQPPLELILSAVAALLVPVYTQVSSIVSISLWQRCMVEPGKHMLSFAVWSKAISAETRDGGLELMQDARALVVPTLLLLTLWPLTSIGLLYLAYLVPMAQSCLVIQSIPEVDPADLNADPVAPRAILVQIQRWLQVWVLHTFLTLLLNPCRGVLAWIPMANLAMGLVYGLLATMTTPMMQRGYGMLIQAELDALEKLVLGDHDARGGESRLIRLVHYVVDQLPRATDHVDEHEPDDPPVEPDNDEPNDPLVQSQRDDSTNENEENRGVRRLGTRTKTVLAARDAATENVPAVPKAKAKAAPTRAHRGTTVDATPRRQPSRHAKAVSRDEESSSSSSYTKDTATSLSRRRRKPTNGSDTTAT